MAEIVIKHSELVALLGSDERREIEALADCPAAIKRLLAELDRIVASMSEPPEDLSQVISLLLQLFSILRRDVDLSPGLFFGFSDAIYDILIGGNRASSGSFFEAGIIVSRKSDLLIYLSEHFSAEVFTLERLSELLDVLGNEEFDKFVRRILTDCEFDKDARLLDAAIRFIKKEHTTQSTDKFLPLYDYLDQRNLLNQDRVILLMSLPNDSEIRDRINVIIKLGPEPFYSIPELIDQILSHPHLKKIYQILTSHVIEFDEGTIRALFSHPNAPALLAALENYKQLPSELINFDNLLLVLKNPDPAKQVESLRADALRKISEAVVSPVDVMGSAVTDKSSRVTRLDAGAETPDAQAAARIIQDRVRMFLHAKRLNRMTLFSNQGEYKRARAVIIPEILEEIFPATFRPEILFPSTTHATNQLAGILHDGRVYPMNVAKKEGMSIASDLARGDGMMVFTSPSHHLYGGSQHMVLQVDRMFDAASGNRGQNVLFKLMDWAALEKDYAYPYTEIMPNLNIRLLINDGKLVWEVVCEAGRYEVKLPQEDYVFHGKQGLNRYLSFFLFKVFEDKAIPLAVSMGIYLQLSQLKPEVIIERFHNVMRNNVGFPELDYLGKFELNFMMLSSFQLSETKQINCNAIRHMIERHDIVNIEALFSDLETRRLFSKSYFLVKGMYEYAVEKKADVVVEFIDSAFENTLKLAEKLSTDSAAAADSADGSVVPPSAVSSVTPHWVDTGGYERKAGGPIEIGDSGSELIHHLLSTEGDRALVSNAVTPSEVDLLVNHLSRKREDVLSYLNRNPLAVERVLVVCEKTFGSIKEITSLGLVSTLIKQVVAHPEFQALLKGREECKILLYLAATQGNFEGLTLDDALIEKLRNPLFDVRNGFTGTGITANFWGLENQVGARANASLLADLLFNVPPQWLFVPQNAVDEKSNPEFCKG
jgi:hypothetical protein